MEFTLYYRGELKANGNAKDKHSLRKHFHRQLRNLWSQLPLVDFGHLLTPRTPDKPLGVVRELSGFRFVPLVAENVHLVAELEITLLRPELPGRILTSGGDIDNRMKTFLDSLKVPSEPTALPSGARPDADEDPFYCLLEDDALITKLSIHTDRLLEPGVRSGEVVLLMVVRTKQLRVVIDTVGLA